MFDMTCPHCKKEFYVVQKKEINELSEHIKKLECSLNELYKEVEYKESIINELNHSLENVIKEKNKLLKDNKHTSKRVTSYNTIKQYYIEGKSVREIVELTNLSQSCVENKILKLFETHDDINIDLDYFDLTEEIEKEIKLAILKVGTSRLRPIKNLVNSNITWSQIKLCIIVVKFEYLQ